MYFFGDRKQEKHLKEKFIAIHKISTYLTFCLSVLFLGMCYEYSINMTDH